jgi:hypothetical protein
MERVEKEAAVTWLLYYTRVFSEEWSNARKTLNLSS